jgi:cytochrome c oxidase subunit 2
MDPDDPNGQDDLLVYNPEAHLPIDKPVKFLLRSKDVLHNFTVTQFRVKMDLVPGTDTFLWLTPTVPGRFEVLCEELCGIAHHTMRGAVIVEEQEAYETWLSQQSTWAMNSAKAAGNADVGAAQYAVCAACHGQEGEGLQALNAPKLAGQSEWYLRKQILNYQSGARGAHEDDVYGKQMAPMAATLGNEAAIANVIAHIQTLPDKPAAATIKDDVDVAKGERLYNICSYCHGDSAQGVQAMNAPRMAGMSDWYMKRQLENFQQEIRGQHPTDFYGFQMSLMARTLYGEQDVNDLIAYINTL